VYDFYNNNNNLSLLKVTYLP